MTRAILPDIAAISAHGRRIEDMTETIMRSLWDVHAARDVADRYGVTVAQVNRDAEVINFVLDVILQRRGQLLSAIDRQAEAITDLAADAHRRYSYDAPGPSVSALGVAVKALALRHKMIEGRRDSGNVADQREAKAWLREFFRAPPQWALELLNELGYVRLESKNE